MHTCFVFYCMDIQFKSQTIFRKPQIAISNNLSFNSFKYICNDLIPNKKGDITFITKKKIGSYIFLMDE